MQRLSGAQAVWNNRLTWRARNDWRNYSEKKQIFTRQLRLCGAECGSHYCYFSNLVLFLNGYVAVTSYEISGKVRFSRVTFAWQADTIFDCVNRIWRFALLFSPKLKFVSIGSTWYFFTYFVFTNFQLNVYTFAATRLYLCQRRMCLALCSSSSTIFSKTIKITISDPWGGPVPFTCL